MKFTERIVTIAVAAVIAAAISIGAQVNPVPFEPGRLATGWSPGQALLRTATGQEWGDIAGGSSWSSGTAAPSGGADGNLYLRTGSTDPGIYLRSGGSWTRVFQDTTGGGVSLPTGTLVATNGDTCPPGSVAFTSLAGRLPIGVTTNGTLGNTMGTAYADSDGPVRAGGTAHTHGAAGAFRGNAATIASSSHSHGPSGGGSWWVSTSSGAVDLLTGTGGVDGTSSNSTSSTSVGGSITPSGNVSVSVFSGGGATAPAPTYAVGWCRFS